LTIFLGGRFWISVNHEWRGEWVHTIANDPGTETACSQRSMAVRSLESELVATRSWSQQARATSCEMCLCDQMNIEAYRVLGNSEKPGSGVECWRV
jgi:hypothetical protein